MAHGLGRLSCVSVIGNCMQHIAARLHAPSLKHGKHVGFPPWIIIMGNFRTCHHYILRPLLDSLVLVLLYRSQLHIKLAARHDNATQGPRWVLSYH